MLKVTVLLTAICLISNNQSLAQRKFSLSSSIGSGISFFSGEGSTSKSVYYRNGLTFPYEVDSIANHWGQNNFSNFVIGLQGDLKLSPKWVLLLSTQYERSGGKLTADSVYTPSVNYKTNGKYMHYCNNISLNPQIGYVTTKKILRVTLHAGIDYTLKLNSGGQFDFIDQNGVNTSIGYVGGDPNVNDFRITTGATFSIRKWALDINYKHGLTNYNKHQSQQVYSHLINFRLMFRIF